MALIKCPECGKEVSSNANQCIHCGCKFTVCPECGNVTVGEVSICQKCGYAFKKTVSDNSETNDKSVSDSDLLKKCKEVSQINGTIKKTLKFAIFILPLIFTAILGFAFIKWQNSDEIKKFLTLTKTSDTIKAMLALICVLYIISVLYESFFEIYTQLKSSNWIKNNKIDGIGFLRCHTNDFIDEIEVDDYQLFTDAVYFADKAEHKNSIFIKLIVKTVCVAAVFTCGGICVMQNLTEAMNAKIYGRPFDFQFVTLIVTGVLAIVSFISVFLLSSFYNKKFNVWFTKNIETVSKVS